MRGNELQKLQIITKQARGRVWRWSGLIRPDQTWPDLIRLGQKWSDMIRYDHICSHLVRLGGIWSYLMNLPRQGRVWGSWHRPHGLVAIAQLVAPRSFWQKVTGSILALRIMIRPEMIRRGQKWSYLPKHGETWPSWVRFGPTWSGVIRFGQVGARFPSQCSLLGVANNYK